MGERMKKLLILLTTLCCFTVFAETYTMDWYMDGETYTQTTCQPGDDVILPQTPYKYGYTFDGWITYTPIEYLESTGTQWIDTGYKPNNNTRVMCEYETDSGAYVFGARHGPNSSEFDIYIDTRTIIQCTFGSSRIEVRNIEILSLLRDNISFLDMSKNGLILKNIDGSLQYQTTFSAQTFQTNYNMIIFGLNNAGSKLPQNVKIYYFQIYDNNVLVRDFIPVLDATGTPCMFDKVTKQFFYNQGTGNFIAGPAI